MKNIILDTLMGLFVFTIAAIIVNTVGMLLAKYIIYLSGIVFLVVCLWGCSQIGKVIREEWK